MLCNSLQIGNAFQKNGIPYAKYRRCALIFSLQSTNPNLEKSIENLEPAYRRYFENKATDQMHSVKMLGWVTKRISAEGKTLLDIGCGSGKFVKFLRLWNRG